MWLLLLRYIVITISRLEIGAIVIDKAINDQLEGHINPNGAIRLHPGPISLGCVTVGSEKRDDSNENWRKIESIIKNTQKGTPFKYHNDGYIKNYGTMKVERNLRES